MGSDINYFVKVNDPCIPVPSTISPYHGFRRIRITDIFDCSQRYLKDLTTRPVPQVDGPGKRASVAVVIRLKYINESTPSFSERPYSPAETKIAVTEPPLITVGERRPCQASQIEACFSNEWTKYAIPEILFIKRASRAGDRWTGHVALPGGKRDKTDAGDEAAAVRECLEEVRRSGKSGEVARRMVSSWC